ncbi:MAG: carbohydrate ABC transporter permease [Chloroflexi bacterium]|nr:carbohydrate ABC transporter permease [Chloroflexota bacterium]
MAAGDVTLGAHARPALGRTTARRRLTDGLLVTALIVIAITFIFPFFWTVSSSLKEPSELYTFPPQLLPKVPQWVNYPTVLRQVPFLTWVGNSLVIVALSTAGIVITASMAGYGFARFQFRGRGLLFILTLGTLMLPSQVTLIPQYILFHKLGWINTHYPLWVPFWFGGGAFSIFLMRQFIMTLPKELDESAVIDGAGYARIFWSILLPLCKPAIATIAVIAMIARWNDYLEPLIYLTTKEKFTVALGLTFFRDNPEQGGIPTQHLLMAGSVMTIVPVIVLFFVAQRFFVQGIALSGLKG